tara:strand:- start:13677 stop:14270 length:594 start_codon:yes stop_codon:yes gene_type:complete
LTKINSYSQNINEKKWNSENFDFVFLKLDFISQITINESTSREIYIKYKQEGEFKEKVLLRTNGNDRKLYIQEIASPISKGYNDKLSVHKTVANTIEVSVPVNFKTIIKAQSSSIKIMSSFSDINIEIEEGKVDLNQKKIKGRIKSISANIFCVNPDDKLLVRSKDGIVSGLHNHSMKPNLILESVRGNISNECFIN